jgi:hypothetical protein
MPVIRQVKRSRRISKQDPLKYDGGLCLLFVMVMSFLLTVFGLVPPAFDVELKIYPPETHTPVPQLDDFPKSPPVLPSMPLPEHTPFIPRPSHSRKHEEGHIPRPPNAFMLFRSDLWAKKRVNSNVERDHRQISRIAAGVWNSLSEEQRRPFREQAMAEKERHALNWPNYKYSPVSRKLNNQRKRSRKEGDFGRQAKCKKLVSLLKQGIEGDDLENALKIHGDVDEKKFEPTVSETTLHPSTSSSIPISVAQPIRRLLTKVPTPEVERESTESPEFVSSGSPFVSGFVRTEDIPPLDLSALHITEVC